MHYLLPLCVQVIGALSVVAKMNVAICNACRVASDKTENATTKRNFVQMAKDVANGTSALVQAVKVLADFLFQMSDFAIFF